MPTRKNTAHAGEYPANLVSAVFGDIQRKSVDVHGLIAAMKTLPKEEESSLILRYAAKQSFGAIGNRLGLSEEGAQETIRRALRKLRHPSRSKMILMPANQKGE